MTGVTPQYLVQEILVLNFRSVLWLLLPLDLEEDSAPCAFLRCSAIEACMAASNMASSASSEFGIMRCHSVDIRVAAAEGQVTGQSANSSILPTLEVLAV